MTVASELHPTARSCSRILCRPGRPPQWFSGSPLGRRGHGHVHLPLPEPESASPAVLGEAAARQVPTSSSRHSVPTAELAGPRLAGGSRRGHDQGLEATRATSRSRRQTSARGPRSAPALGPRAPSLCLPVPAGLRVRRERREAAAEGGRERGGRRAGGRGGARGGERGRRRGTRRPRGADPRRPGGPGLGPGPRMCSAPLGAFPSPGPDRTRRAPSRRPLPFPRPPARATPPACPRGPRAPLPLGGTRPAARQPPGVRCFPRRFESPLALDPSRHCPRRQRAT